MALLHTWTGIIFGSVLFVIFFMGSLAVFDREIDRWMMPVTRIPLASNAPPKAPLSFDAAILPAVAELSEGMALEQWFVVPPSSREPFFRIRFWDTQGESHDHFLHPVSADILPEVGTLGATSFFYPFHYSLHLQLADIGYWIVGIAAMAMLVLLTSGVIIHARMFKDFFAFRPQKQTKRALLDLHNLSGAVALPFHFVITLSGLVISFYFYMPTAISILYTEGASAFAEETQGSYWRVAANRSGELASLDTMVEFAKQQWGHGEASFLRVWHPGDAGAFVEVSRSVADRIRVDEQTMYFDAASGSLLKYSPLSSVASFQRFIGGLHVIKFDHWILRWLYFITGLLGCVMIGTGLVYWLEKRATHAQADPPGVRWMASFTCASITGLLIATLTMLIANRLLPSGLTARASWEVGMFFLAWFFAGVHAAVTILRHDKTRIAFCSQCWFICFLGAVAPLLNWITTGDHVIKALARTQWAVLGVDLFLFITAITAGLCAVKLAQRNALDGSMTQKA